MSHPRPADPAPRAATPAVSSGLHLVCEIDVLEPCLDPAHIYDFVADGVAGLLHDTLFRIDAAGMVVPGIATGWSMQGRDWTIDLARDRHFADGTAIGAEHVVAAFETLRREGARRWLGAMIETMVAPTPHRLAIRTARPIGYLRELLSSVLFAPRASDPAIGSGPYRLVQAYPGRQGLVLRRDGPSPRAQAEGPDWLTLLRTEEAHQGVRLFRQGHVQLSCGTIFPHRLADDPDLRQALQQAPSTLGGQLLPNVARLPQLADPRARHALSLAVDRSRLGRRFAPVLDPWHDLASLWEDGGAVPGADEAAARAAWNAAGRPLEHIEISYADFPPNGELLACVAEDVERSLSCRVTLRRLDYQDYVRVLATGDYGIAYAILSPPFADPAAALLPFATPGALPQAIALSPAFHRAFATAEAMLDAPTRRAAMRGAAALLMESMPVIPLARTRICHLVADGLSIPMLPGGLPDYAHIRRRNG